jgi:hypothetical protein
MNPGKAGHCTADWKVALNRASIDRYNLHSIFKPHKIGPELHRGKIPEKLRLFMAA